MQGTELVRLRSRNPEAVDLGWLSWVGCVWSHALSAASLEDGDVLYHLCITKKDEMDRIATEADFCREKSADPQKEAPTAEI